MPHFGREARSKVDGLTPVERRVVKAAVENPAASPEDLIKLASIGGATMLAKKALLRRMMGKPIVLDAIRNPPESVTGKAVVKVTPDIRDPEAVKKRLFEEYWAIVDHKLTPQGARIQALNDIKEMVLGKAPQTVKMEGEIRSIADVVRAAGRGPQAPGRAPEDAPPATKH